MVHQARTQRCRDGAQHVDQQRVQRVGVASRLPLQGIEPGVEVVREAFLLGPRLDVGDEEGEQAVRRLDIGAAVGPSQEQRGLEIERAGVRQRVDRLLRLGEEALAQAAPALHVQTGLLDQGREEEQAARRVSLAVRDQCRGDARSGQKSGCVVHGQMNCFSGVVAVAKIFEPGSDRIVIRHERLFPRAVERPARDRRSTLARQQ